MSDGHKYNMTFHNLIECLFYYRWRGVIGRGGLPQILAHFRPFAS